MSFFLQIKKFINYTSRATLWQKNSFVAEVTFKNLRHPPFIQRKLTLACFYIVWMLQRPELRCHDTHRLDYDAVILAVSFFEKINTEEFRIAFGS